MTAIKRRQQQRFDFSCDTSQNRVQFREASGGAELDKIYDMARVWCGDTGQLGSTGVIVKSNRVLSVAD